MLASTAPLTSDLVSATWAGPDSIVIATEDGCVSALDTGSKTPGSPVTNEPGRIYGRRVYIER